MTFEEYKKFTSSTLEMFCEDPNFNLVLFL